MRSGKSVGERLKRHLGLTVISAFLLSLPSFCSAAPQASMSGLERLHKDAQELTEKGDLIQAREKYRKLLSKKLPSVLKKTAGREAEALNLRILFSDVPMPESTVYEVKAGDSLYKIARENNTTIELLKKSNGLETDIIRPGQKLKVIKEPFSITVDRSANRLYLILGGEIFKTYRVATGKDLKTPLGTFTIETKLIDPTWYPDGGAAVPPESPDNILGTRWMGFSLPSFGIHGTTLPESIGTHSTSGCIRMRNEDVEELFSIVPVKTKVTVAE
ncbi:MAG TPA: L,D-transpeptidase family protein [Candidatus Omnitrophota bacterium]|nr:L,D-transpeptidase family protein [Candidatus Omnitrophota bacterium]